MPGGATPPTTCLRPGAPARAALQQRAGLRERRRSTCVYAMRRGRGRRDPASQDHPRAAGRPLRRRPARLRSWRGDGAFNLATNESVNNRSDLRSLISVFQARPARDGLQSVDRAALDVNQLLRFTAAEAAVNQRDMYAYTVFYPEQHLPQYTRPASNKSVFLPRGMAPPTTPFRGSGETHISTYGRARSGDRASGPVSAGPSGRRSHRSAVHIDHARLAGDTAVRHLNPSWCVPDRTARASR